jgi:putative endopeptidase
LRNIVAICCLAAVLLMNACRNSTPVNRSDETGMKVYHGLLLANMDTTVSPREDFFRYANGDYLQRTQIPAEEGRWGTFSELYDINNLRLKAIMEECGRQGAAKGSIEQKIGDYFKTAMDSLAIEQLGVHAVKGDLDKIAAIKTAAETMPLIAAMHRRGMKPMFGTFVHQDAKNSARYILNFYQGGTGLPERDYYFSTSQDKEHIRKQYLAYVARLLVLSGEVAGTADAQAAKYLEMETRLAEKSMGKVELRDPDANYHLMRMDDLKRLVPQMDWNAYFTAIGISDPGEFKVGQPEFFKNLGVLVADYPIEDWKCYLKVQLLMGTAGRLSNDFVVANFDFYERTLKGAEKMRVRWKRIVRAANDDLGFALGQKYTEKHFSPNAKKIALEMVDNILAVMIDRLAKLEWMGDSTRRRAIHKVETIIPKIGYPDKWRDYSKVEIVPDNYLRNVHALRESEFQYHLDKMGKPVDKTEWDMPPQIVNAYYNSSMNEIVFPAGILQQPFFDKHVDAAMNYGAFGAVVGHELIHAFDDQGSKYDADGNLRSWWTEEDRKRFEALAAVVRDQYSAYQVADSLFINGQLTLGENIADIHGLQMSYWAWKRLLERKEPPKPQDGFTPDQRFFIAYAQIYRSLIRPEYLRLTVATDPHSPPEYRVLGALSSFSVFHDAFGVKEGDRMFREEAQRSAIW